MMNVTFTVPGSEKFHSRQIPLDELRKLISPSLKLHDLSQDAANSIDPITYEVVRHRLWSVTEEMGEALKRMSGSVVVTDANDFNFTITDEVGQEVQIGPYNLHLAASMDLAITWTLQHRSKNPGIKEGDMFLCNDPWVGGGLHQNDVSVFAPLFWDGELFGWSAAAAHQVDVGGVAPGSWTPRSRDVFWESLPTPPVKLVNDYEIVTDVEDLFVRRSRVPKLVALDLRAMIAANKIAHERLKNLVRRYGSNVVKAAMRRIMDDAERRLRAKLTALPDGTWRSVAYQEEAFEGDRGIYKIVLTMTKKADHIIFDFRGTDPQTGMINCTYAGMRAGVLSPVLTIVGGDIPWAPGGIVRCIEIISEEGTLNNATFPAGICKASVASTWATNNAVVECVSKMLDASQEHRKSGMSVSCGTWLLSVLAGTNQYRIPFVTMLMEPMASGLGAKFYRDGIDTGGSADIPMGRAPDAEMTEFMFPVLLIWRREETDSGGPGRFRGGLTGSILLVPHGTDSPLQLVCSGSGRTVSMNLGLAGGYPGNNELAMIIRNGNSRKLLRAGSTPGKLDDLKGERDVLPDETETTLNPDDAYYMCWQAGGGYADPILRDPTAVERDVRDFRVSVEAARDLYGVVVDPKTLRVDQAATQSRRDDLRRTRKGMAAPPTKLPVKVNSGVMKEALPVQRIDENLVIKKYESEHFFACTHCGTLICRQGENYLENLQRYEGPSFKAGPLIWPEPARYVDKEVVFRQYYCPGCLTAFLTEVVPADHPEVSDKDVAVKKDDDQRH